MFCCPHQDNTVYATLKCIEKSFEYLSSSIHILLCMYIWNPTGNTIRLLFCLFIYWFILQSKAPKLSNKANRKLAVITSNTSMLIRETSALHQVLIVRLKNMLLLCNLIQWCVMYNLIRIYIYFKSKIITMGL